MKNKKVFIVIGALVLIVASFLIYRTSMPKDASDILESKDIEDVSKISAQEQFFNSNRLVMVKEVNLRPETVEFLNKRIADYQAKISAFNEKTTIIEKVNVYFALSVDYKTLGQYGKSKELLEQAMSIDPKNSNLIQTYSVLIAMMGDKRAALQYINRAIDLYSAEQSYWMWKIDLEKDLGLSASGIEATYKNALEKTSGDINIITSYAQFLESQNRKEDAIVQWQKAIEIYPQNKTIYQAEIDRLSK